MKQPAATAEEKAFVEMDSSSSGRQNGVTLSIKLNYFRAPEPRLSMADDIRTAGSGKSTKLTQDLVEIDIGEIRFISPKKTA